TLRSACSASAWDCTDTYSPAAIDMAPDTVPATPVASTVAAGAPLAAMPTTSPATETMPSLAPSTAARSQPTRSERWTSGCLECLMRTVYGLHVGDSAMTRSCGAGRPGAGSEKVSQ